MSVVKTIVPSNVFNSISGASPNMLHIMFFALIVGIAITLLARSGFRAVYRVYGIGFRYHFKDYRHHYEVRAVCGGVSDFQQHRAIRLRPSAIAGVVRHNGLLGLGIALFRRLFAVGVFSVAH
jgi:hypothetical protein